MDNSTSPPVETVPISRLFCSPSNPRQNDQAVPHVASWRHEHQGDPGVIGQRFARLALRQRASGAWDGNWNEDLVPRRVEEDETLRRVTELTVTGHVLEALLAMPDQILVEEGMVRRALAWVTERARSELNQVAPLGLLCPWTHCICSAHRVARGD